jgi:periplasmic mercuric ion binding protein
MKKLSLVIVLVGFFASFTSFSQVVKHKEEEISIKTSAVCGMCKNTIEKDLSYEKGVKSAKLDVKTSVLTVKYDQKKTSPEKIRTALSKIGYDADGVKADAKAYEKLDSCCKKDKIKH